LAKTALSIEQACRALSGSSEDDVIAAYTHGDLRGVWGAPYHYVCIARPPDFDVPRAGVAAFPDEPQTRG
jgi:hypothetical protein